jgi:hypothetical protein
MNRILDGVRAGDALLAAALTAFGVFLMVANIHSHDGTRVDSRTWLLVPVFAAATLPILWRRRHLALVLAVSAAALLVHVVAFGWMVRCGVGLPLACALSYAVGRLGADRIASVLGLLVTLGIQALVLVRDSAAGIEVLPATAAIGVVVWGVGAWLRHRTAREHDVTAPDRVETFA